MSTLDEAFDALQTALKRHYGPAARKFDGLAPVEAMLAVVLGRELGGSRWRAVLDGLNDHELLRADRLADAEIPEITDAMSERGVKATGKTIGPLKRLARWVADHAAPDSLSSDFADADAALLSVNHLREELGSIKGIGPATADAIVLFGLKRPSYPVDRATYRVLVRHGWLDPSASYDDARDCLVDRALSACDEEEEAAVTTLSELSHGMERIGQQYCRATRAHCGGCPLESLLPDGGPREVDA